VTAVNMERSTADILYQAVVVCIGVMLRLKGQNFSIFCSDTNKLFAAKECLIS
jgi:hypothetical protein